MSGEMLKKALLTSSTDDEDEVKHYASSSSSTRSSTLSSICSKSSLCIMGAGFCGYAAYGGIFFNLVLYLTEIYHRSTATAFNDVTNLLGTMFFTSLVGAFLSDAYWGKMQTSLVFLIIFFIGIVLSSVAVTWQQLFYPVNYPPHSYVKVVTYFENEGNWAVGFWVSSTAVLMTGVIFLVGLPVTRQLQSCSGNPFLRIVQVIISAIRKSPLKVDSNQFPLYEISGSKSAIRGCRKILHTNKLRWFDRAAMITKHRSDEMLSLAPNPWHICTITQVEEVKCIVAIMPIIATGILFNTVLAQILTLFIEQGSIMDKALGSYFNIPTGSMQVFTILAVVLYAPLYDYTLVPLLRKKTGCPTGLTTLQRIGWGYAISIVAMIVAALVEIKRLNALPQPLSIFWLVPQYLISGVSLALTIVGQMDFFYTEISDGMRSLGISIPLVCRGLGNYGSTLLVTIVTNVTTSGGGIGWIPENLNEGHVDRFYWLLAIFMVVTLVLHLISSHFYIYLESDKEEDETYDSPQHC